MVMAWVLLLALGFAVGQFACRNALREKGIVGEAYRYGMALQAVGAVLGIAAIGLMLWLAEPPGPDGVYHPHASLPKLGAVTGSVAALFLVILALHARLLKVLATPNQREPRESKT